MNPFATVQISVHSAEELHELSLLLKNFHDKRVGHDNTPNTPHNQHTGTPHVPPTTQYYGGGGGVPSHHGGGAVGHGQQAHGGTGGTAHQTHPGHQGYPGGGGAAQAPAHTQVPAHNTTPRITFDEVLKLQNHLIATHILNPSMITGIYQRHGGSINAPLTLEQCEAVYRDLHGMLPPQQTH